MCNRAHLHSSDKTSVRSLSSCLDTFLMSRCHGALRSARPWRHGNRLLTNYLGPSPRRGVVLCVCHRFCVCRLRFVRARWSPRPRWSPPLQRGRGSESLHDFALLSPALRSSLAVFTETLRLIKGVQLLRVISAAKLAHLFMITCCHQRQAVVSITC